MLEIKNITKTFGDKIAVDNVSLTINSGEICAFIGHNGAGKSTTLKGCCGLLQMDAGEIFINGISVSKSPIDAKKIIAYLPDNPDLYEFLSGIKYLNFIADIFNVPKQQREERIEQYANLFELTNDLAETISGYSHGMKQKLSIIAALIHKPKLIIMDEPFVGLDPKASHLFKEIMRSHCEEGGAIFFSTHVLEVAEKLCNKVAIIKNGKLLKYGNMEEIKGDISLEEVFLELEENKSV